MSEKVECAQRMTDKQATNSAANSLSSQEKERSTEATSRSGIQLQLQQKLMFPLSGGGGGGGIKKQVRDCGHE